MEFLRERPSDLAAIRAVVEAAFPTPAEALLVKTLRDAGDAVVSAVAVEHGELLGHVMLSKMTGPFPMVGLAPVAVLPARQNQQIGSRLVTYALDLARNDRWFAVFVLGDPRYYGRFGFSADLAKGFQSPYAGSNFMALALGRDLPVRSGQVDYASAFASLDQNAKTPPAPMPTVDSFRRGSTRAGAG